ncbi:MAG: hypothetical protein A2Y33_03470 [Spirochaetes bacterium GWF1_51_8]|nr:MAG: hypothetical protein A2Y33_03470 [Spirochaetes bacterium GWF1_51_8]
MPKKELSVNKGPDFIKYFPAIVEVLRELGGSGNPREIYDSIIDRFQISEEELDKKNKKGESNYRNKVAWAKFYLSKGGFVDSSKRGVWALTEKGNNENITENKVYEIFKEIHTQFLPNNAENKEPDKLENVQIEKKIEKKIEEEEEKGHRKKLLSTIQELSPSGFEKLCQRLLRESGFTQVTVTGQKGDQGIDGFGMLEINPLLSIKVYFQSKKYTKTVGPDKIRDFQGAIGGKSEKGIFITTGRFTKEAKVAAVRDGAIPIELIDGDRLVERFEQLELGLKPKTVYEINYSFFDEFK